MSLEVLLLVFFDGLATFVSPCLLPLLPVYIFYLTGTKLEDYNNTLVDKKILIKNSVGFIIGFSIIFILLGAASFSFSKLIQSNHNTVRIVSGLIIVFFGFNFLGIIKLGFLDFDKRIDYKFKSLKFFSSIIFGIVFGLAWTPCGSKYLIVALSLAANVNTIFSGMFLLFIYSLGLGIPLFITAIIFDTIKDSFKVILKYTNVINKISGIILIIVGTLLIMDKLYF